MMTADEIIATLNLAPHPEGGHYRQTWAADSITSGADGRPTATCIYFLLRKGEASHWHRVDAAELWLYHAGAPLILSLAATDTGPARDHVLGPDLASGAQPQLIVPDDHWQMAQHRRLDTGQLRGVSGLHLRRLYPRSPRLRHPPH